MLRPIAATALCFALATTAAAANFRTCDGFVANASNVMWSDPTRTFANGAIRLIALDTEEPVGNSHHIMVLHPGPNDPYGKCTLISGDNGWTGVSLSQAATRYDPARGLAITIPTTTYNGAGNDPAQITILINQSTGQIFAQ